MFVLYTGEKYIVGYYTGKSYTYQGSLYAVVGNFEEAKVYKNDKTAQRILSTHANKYENVNVGASIC